MKQTKNGQAVLKCSFRGEAKPGCIVHRGTQCEMRWIQI
ncbi:hypothetical protein AG1IA_09340 [Rhizoctonia solani AG-1 IA]|uniref:Uncharacterized protein n=1 Tax=Thanatephorus cucumeris (strain AG1-IA) TaxID=983506 RepID=L8WF82_THACA|nr:hypothetical protein AG1IA_09340 [Rhizoctonia solani AG-1 IA]